MRARFASRLNRSTATARACNLDSRTRHTLASATMSYSPSASNERSIETARKPRRCHTRAHRRRGARPRDPRAPPRASASIRPSSSIILAALHASPTFSSSGRPSLAVHAEASRRWHSVPSCGNVSVKNVQAGSVSSLGRSAGAMARAGQGRVHCEKSRPADLMYRGGSDARMERSRRYVTDITAVTVGLPARHHRGLSPTGRAGPWEREGGAYGGIE